VTPFLAGTSKHPAKPISKSFANRGLFESCLGHDSGTKEPQSGESLLHVGSFFNLVGRNSVSSVHPPPNANGLGKEILKFHRPLVILG